MLYVALLRGINVGGNRKVDMKRLAATFERTGMRSVRTYINSGNVIFVDETRDAAALVAALEPAIEADFGFPVPVIVRDAGAIRATVAGLDSAWANDHVAKCDVLFLRPEVDHPDILKQLTIKPTIDEVVYVPGAVLWRVEREKVTRSGLMKIVGTDLYSKMTVRNCNTLHKLADLMV